MALEIFKNVCNQIDSMKLDSETVKKLNNFFKEVNNQLKGDTNTLVMVIYPNNNQKYIKTNLLNDNMDLITIEGFKSNLKEYLEGFLDNKELFMDILMILSNNNLLKVNNDLKLLLFKKIYYGGFFCYVAFNLNDFKENLEYIKPDLEIIGSCIDFDNLKDIESELKIITKEFYLIEGYFKLYDFLDLDLIK